MGGISVWHVGSSAEDLVAVHGSSGTGGRPMLVGYTRADLVLWARMCARALAAAGATRASTVHNAYGYGLFTGGLGIHQGAIELGATVVPVSCGGMTARQVTLIRDLMSTRPRCTPSYAIRSARRWPQRAPAGEGLSLKAGLFGAEPWTAQMRARIEELLGLAALDIYGLSEVIGPGVAAECLERRTACTSTRTISSSRRWTRRPVRRCPTAPPANWCSAR